MKRTNEMALIIEDLRGAAAVMHETADRLAELFGGNEPELNREEVRALLADVKKLSLTVTFGK